METDEIQDEPGENFIDTDVIERLTIAKLIQLSSSADTKISLDAAKELSRIVNARKDREVDIIRTTRSANNFGNGFGVPSNTFNILANPELAQRMSESLLLVVGNTIKSPQGVPDENTK
jgi:hypothetical protein